MMMAAHCPAAIAFHPFLSASLLTSFCPILTITSSSSPPSPLDRGRALRLTSSSCRRSALSTSILSVCPSILPSLLCVITPISACLSPFLSPLTHHVYSTTSPYTLSIAHCYLLLGYLTA
mmetsp:Transcript_2324/g.4802  ORF Transcript_2324/g.4802 Transcript_2324/m.4802 type:complete len:120 (-) Transcript_2324:81-440(-)